MIEVIENKVKRSLLIRKINVWVMVSTIATFCIALLFLISDNLYFRFLFLLPIGGAYYYWHRIKTYKKDIEYLPKFLHAYSRLKEKEDEGEYIGDGEEKIKVVYKTKFKDKIVYKDKIIYKDKVVYKDNIVNKPVEVEKIIYKDKPIEKIVYRDKIVEKPVEKIIEKPIEKIVYVDKEVEKIVYKTKSNKAKKGYIKKKNIYEDNVLR